MYIIKDIDNFSGFVQICLTQAADIMQFAIMKKEQGYKNTAKMKDVKADYNREFPLDELTAKRLGKWPANSPKKPEIW